MINPTAGACWCGLCRRHVRDLGAERRVEHAHGVAVTAQPSDAGPTQHGTLHDRHGLHPLEGLWSPVGIPAVRAGQPRVVDRVAQDPLESHLERYVMTPPLLSCVAWLSRPGPAMQPNRCGIAKNRDHHHIGEPAAGPKEGVVACAVTDLRYQPPSGGHQPLDGRGKRIRLAIHGTYPSVRPVVVRPMNVTGAGVAKGRPAPAGGWETDGPTGVLTSNPPAGPATAYRAHPASRVPVGRSPPPRRLRPHPRRARPIP